MRRLTWPAFCLLAATAGCNFAPHYDRPPVAAGTAFKETGGGGDAASQGWKLAQAREAPVRDAWWKDFGDPVLDALEERVVISNQSVAAAAANYRAAAALTREAQAQLFPTLSLNPSATRTKSSSALQGLGGSATTVGGATTTVPTTGAGTTTAATSTVSQSTSASPHNVFTLPLEASYQIDLWGSVRNTVAENRFAAEASAAQLANAILSTQSTLAQDYFQLRVADEQRRILDGTVVDYRASLKLVRTLVASGVDSEADVASAESQLQSALASATDAGIARAQYEHAIAVLVGESPDGFSIAYQRFHPVLPVIPVGVPSDLLERRPDIAAAERQVAETNAAIGVARAAYFPTLSLSASGGYESTAVSTLFKAPNRFWSVGPSLAQSLFDGGERRAAVAQARAQNDSQVATYRQTVLAAFQSVEDNLAALRILSMELGQAHEATTSAQRAVELTVVRFRNGLDSYVNVITAQNAFLSARQTELGVQLRQLTASITLVNDLGGGWTAPEMLLANAAAQAPPPSTPGAATTPGASGSTGAPVPNPPSMPPTELEPDRIIQDNADAVGTQH